MKDNKVLSSDKYSSNKSIITRARIALIILLGVTILAHYYVFYENISSNSIDTSACIKYHESAQNIARAQLICAELEKKAALIISSGQESAVNEIEIDATLLRNSFMRYIDNSLQAFHSQGKSKEIADIKDHFNALLDAVPLFAINTVNKENNIKVIGEKGKLIISNLQKIIDEENELFEISGTNLQNSSVAIEKLLVIIMISLFLIYIIIYIYFFQIPVSRESKESKEFIEAVLSLHKSDDELKPVTHVNEFTSIINSIGFAYKKLHHQLFESKNILSEISKTTRNNKNYHQLVQNHNDSFDELKNLVSQDEFLAIQKISTSLSETSTNFASFNQQITGTIAKINSIGKEMEENLSIIKDADKESKNMSDNTENIKKEMSKIFNEINDIGEDEKKRLGEQTKIIGAIEDTSDEVKKVSGEIDAISDLVMDIAQRTSILALNAQVEASRAKEGGEGFKVIADEIKALAGKAADSSQKVKELTDKIEEKIGDLGAKINETKDTFKERSKTYVQKMNALSGEIEKIKESIEGMSEFAKKVDKQTDDLLENINGKIMNELTSIIDTNNHIEGSINDNNGYIVTANEDTHKTLEKIKTIQAAVNRLKESNIKITQQYAEQSELLVNSLKEFNSNDI
ncbi:MAG TPA: methyl-accepting chemotaxis protein [Ignavibacteriaceae bacterium]|nr:methyl-accepting chemotaxis protein [Ignavibacteriaceae bacterium]